MHIILILYHIIIYLYIYTFNFTCILQVDHETCQAGWPKKMLQTCTCWAEDSGGGDPQKIMKELHDEAEATERKHPLALEKHHLFWL